MSLFEKLKKAAPRLWTDRVTITSTEKYKADHNITKSRNVTIVENEPAKIVLKGQSPSTQTIFGTDDTDAKLLIRNGIEIPAGSVVYATDQNGNTVKYKRSSKGYTGYYSHQELALVRDEKA